MMLHDARKPAENGTLQQFNFSRGRMQTSGRGCGGEIPFEEFEELNSYIDQIVRAAPDLTESRKFFPDAGRI